MNTDYTTETPENPVFEWRDAETFPLGEVDAKKGCDVTWFTLFAGYEDLKLFEIMLSTGERELVLGSLNDNGDVCWADSGDDCGWQWDAVSRWSYIPR